jgi:hypothetical protein
VSSYADLYVRGVKISSWRNTVDPVFLFLFTKQDLHRRPADSDDEYGRTEIVHLTASVSTLWDRLNVLGIGKAVLESAFREIKDSELATLRNLRDNGIFGDLGLDEIQQLESITLPTWTEQLVRAIESAQSGGPNDMLHPTSAVALLNLWESADPCLFLGAVMLACSADDEVTLDVSDLQDSGWVDEDSDPQMTAIEHFSYSLTKGSPPVIITEGSSDAKSLQAAIRIRYPHLQSHIKVFDFGDGAEGSAGTGVRTLKSFAAAGISNRVVLLLDNDTAAREAVRALRGSHLPSHYSVLHYPDIELARSYPTLGPNGLTEMDVNGVAASIELYLGADVLTQPDGTLSPVQWRSYSEGVKAYQGAVLHKTEVLKRFEKKVKAAETDPACISSQDWSGLDAIVASLIELLRAPLGSVG